MSVSAQRLRREATSKREELRIAEIELMRQRERVADLRRWLREGAIVQDYPLDHYRRQLQTPRSARV